MGLHCHAPRRKRRGLVCLLGTLVLAAGCAGVQPRATPQGPQTIHVHTLSEAVERYNQQCPAYERLRVQSTVEYVSGATTKSFNAAIFVDAESHKVRLRADAYFISLFDMVVDGDQFTVLVPGRNMLYRGRGESFRGFALQDLSEALRPRPLAPEETAQLLFEEDSRSVVLTEMAALAEGGYRPIQKIYLARPDLALSRRLIYYDTGVLKSELVYASPRDFGAGRFPSRVSVLRPWQNIRLTLNIEKLESPASFKPELFVSTLPAGAKTVDLEPNMSEDILFRTNDGSD